jgi:hypothetical protein
MANNKNISLQDCKEQWAEKWDKTWEEVKLDFEYGNGLSKLYGFEEIMDMVAEIYLENNSTIL